MLRSTKNNLANCTKKSESSSQSARVFTGIQPQNILKLAIRTLWRSFQSFFFLACFFKNDSPKPRRYTKCAWYMNSFQTCPCTSKLCLYRGTSVAPEEMFKSGKREKEERTAKGKREKEDHLQEGGYLSKFQDHCPLSSRRQRHLILIINTWPPCLHSPVALQKLREDSQYLQSCHLVTFWTLLGFNDWIFRLLNPVQLLNWYNVKHLTFWSF